MRDIEHIIATVKESVPHAEVRQIGKSHPADDDGIWIFSVRNSIKTIQLESSTGKGEIVTVTRNEMVGVLVHEQKGSGTGSALCSCSVTDLN